jgi:predicted permease
MTENFPSILFATVGALCAALTFTEWTVRRRLARFPAVVAALAALCFVVNHAWSRYSIRVDLLLTIPFVSLASLTAGALSIRHPPASVRIIGLVLVLLGATSFGWFAWWFAGSTAEAHRLMATFNEGSRLYWNETVRCEANFEKRFGSIQHSDQPCYGDLVVTSRSPGAYPYTRIVVNDKAETSILFRRK